MSKRSKTTKRMVDAQQLKLEYGPLSEPTEMSGTDRSTRKALLLSRLGNQRTLTEHLLDKIVSHENLKKAYIQVKSNHGCAGIDGITIQEYSKTISKRFPMLMTDLLSGKYSPQKVRKVEIPKSTGGYRILGIPTVEDRIVQQAIYQELLKLYDPYHSPYSYGYRPGRSGQEAIEQASQYIKSGHVWVVSIDLEKFFDRINHDRLMNRLSKGIGDKRLLRLINRILQTGVLCEGLESQRIAGTPQGSPLSPLLSNIVLDELDRELTDRGHKFCRYADDCKIYVKSRQAGIRLLESLIKFIEKTLKLKVNRNKSGVHPCSESEFLGYTISTNGKKEASARSLQKLKGKIRETSKRNRGVSFQSILCSLNKLITGWTNYFRLTSQNYCKLDNIDKWIRRRLRCYLLKQTQHRSGTYRLLCRMGVSSFRSWEIVKKSQGWWHLSRNPTVQRVMNNAWFRQRGLRSLMLEVSRYKQ